VARLIVGKPSAQPRLAPCTTRPRTLTARRAAAPRPRRLRRQKIADARRADDAPSMSMGFTTSTTKPSRFPRSRQLLDGLFGAARSGSGADDDAADVAGSGARGQTEFVAESFAKASSKRKDDGPRRRPPRGAA